MATPIPQYDVPPPPASGVGNKTRNRKKAIVAALAFFVTLSVMLAGFWGYSAWDRKRVAERFDAQAELLAAQLEAAAPLVSNLNARTDAAEVIGTSQHLEALDGHVAASREATAALDETVDEWLRSPYFTGEVGEAQQPEEIDSAPSEEARGSTTPNQVKVTYDSAVVPRAKKTPSALKELEQGEARLTEQAEVAIEAVEELEEAVATFEGAVEESEEVFEEPEEAAAAPECAPPVPGAYPCAGRGLPEDAQLIQTVGDYGATAVMPSKNIGCDLFTVATETGTSMSCGVADWPPSMYPDHDPNNGGFIGVALRADSGPATLTQKSEVPNYSGAKPGSPAGQVMEYGNVYHWGDFALASEDNGLTIWSLVSGHGAFFNSEDFYPF